MICHVAPVTRDLPRAAAFFAATLAGSRLNAFLIG